MQTLVERRIYPFLLMVVVLLAILSFQIRQFKRLYEHIKNDKLVDTQVVCASMNTKAEGSVSVQRNVSHVVGVTNGILAIA